MAGVPAWSVSRSALIGATVEIFIRWPMFLLPSSSNSAVDKSGPSCPGLIPVFVNEKQAAVVFSAGFVRDIGTYASSGSPTLLTTSISPMINA